MIEGKDLTFFHTVSRGQNLLYHVLAYFISLIHGHATVVSPTDFLLLIGNSRLKKFKLRKDILFLRKLILIQLKPFS